MIESNESLDIGIPNLKIYNEELSHFRQTKSNKTNDVRSNPNLSDSNKFHTTSKERYKKDWDNSKDFILKSIKSSEYATESTKMIYDIINESPEVTPNKNNVKSKRNLYQKGYQNGKGKYSTFFEELTKSITKKPVKPKISSNMLSTEDAKELQESMIIKSLSKCQEDIIDQPLDEIEGGFLIGKLKGCKPYRPQF